MMDEAAEASTPALPAAPSATPGAAFGRRSLLRGGMAAAAAACLGCSRGWPSLAGVLLGRHPDAVTASVFLDDRHVYSADGGERGRICLWDLQERRLLRTLQFPGSIQYLDIPIGDPTQLLVLGVVKRSDRRRCLLSVIDAATGREIRQIMEDSWGMISVSGMVAMPRARVLVSFADRPIPSGPSSGASTQAS